MLSEKKPNKKKNIEFSFYDHIFLAKLVACSLLVGVTRVGLIHFEFMNLLEKIILIFCIFLLLCACIVLEIIDTNN